MITLKNNISTVLLGLFCFSGSYADAHLMKPTQNDHQLHPFSSNYNHSSSKKEEQPINAAKKILITITEPESETYIHNFNPLIPIKTSPELNKSDDVYVVINSKPIKAIYENNTWKIQRPYPGKNVIYLTGKTIENKEISSNRITVYVYNTHVKKTS